jgi:nucleoside-diphosphate-sugar epimerase
MNTRISQLDLQHVFDHTRELWEELLGQRVFVTGGTGFFGRWLLETFADANERLHLDARLTVLTRDAGAFGRKAPHLAGNPAIELIEGDIRNFAFPAGNFSYLIHGATTSSAPVPPIEMFDTIVSGTRRALDFAVVCGAKKFLLISSGAVYGRQPPDMTHISEDYAGAPDTADPNSAYGEGKRAAELLCAMYSREHGFEIKIARCFAFVGPHLPLDAHFAIGNFIRDALAKKPVCVKSDGTPYRSYLYAADLAIWLWTILFRGKSCRPYNVGSDEALTISQVADAIAVLHQPALTVAIDQRPAPGAVAQRYVPATESAQKELGLQTRIKLREAIERTFLWHSHA